MTTKSKLGTQSTADVREIQKIALTAMNAALKARGLTVKALSGTRGNTAKLRFEFMPGTTKAALVKSTELSQIGSFAGLTTKDIGKTFTSLGHTYRFTDVKTRRFKFPICGVDIKTGKTFKFPKSVANKINPTAYNLYFAGK